MGVCSGVQREGRTSTSVGEAGNRDIKAVAGGAGGGGAAFAGALEQLHEAEAAPVPGARLCVCLHWPAQCAACTSNSHATTDRPTTASSAHNVLISAMAMTPVSAAVTCQALLPYCPIDISSLELRRIRYALPAGPSNLVGESPPSKWRSAKII